ncbi:hypothetical protein VPHK479_0100 [Vibrio phage K479]
MKRNLPTTYLNNLSLHIQDSYGSPYKAHTIEIACHTTVCIASHLSCVSDAYRYIPVLTYTSTCVFPLVSQPTGRLRMKQHITTVLAWCLFIIALPFFLLNKLLICLVMWPLFMVTDGVRSGTKQAIKLLLSKGQ